MDGRTACRAQLEAPCASPPLFTNTTHPPAPPAPARRQVHRAEREARRRKHELAEYEREKEDLVASVKEVEEDFVRATQVGAALRCTVSCCAASTALRCAALCV